MPRGLRGEKRPADVIGAAVKVMRIATGEETEEIDLVKSAAAELGSRGGKARASAHVHEHGCASAGDPVCRPAHASEF